MFLSPQNHGSRDPWRVSVLINNRNNGPYLVGCIESVLRQTRPADEIIVFDDGSTDESRPILARYAGRVRTILAEAGRGNALQNQAAGIAAAFHACSGDVIFLLDGDDSFLPQKIAAYLDAFARQPGAVMVQAPLERIDAAGNHLGIEYEAPRHQSDYQAHIYEENELNIYYPTSALAFRREYLAASLPLDFSDGLHVWADARLALLAPLAGGVITLPLPYTQWRRHAQSHTVALSVPIYHLVRANQRYFNARCRERGLPGITPWRSWRQWMRAAAYYFVAARWMRGYRVLRWATLGRRKREELRGTPMRYRWLKQELDRLKAEAFVPARDDTVNP